VQTISRGRKAAIRDADALALARREGIRVAIHVLRLEAHRFEQLFLPALEFRAVGQAWMRCGSLTMSITSAGV
jgi:hypothetical protein